MITIESVIWQHSFRYPTSNEIEFLAFSEILHENEWGDHRFYQQQLHCKLTKKRAFCKYQYHIKLTLTLIHMFDFICCYFGQLLLHYLMIMLSNGYMKMKHEIMRPGYYGCMYIYYVFYFYS